MLDMETRVVPGVVPWFGADGNRDELFKVTFRDIVRGLDFDGEGMDGHVELPP